MDGWFTPFSAKKFLFFDDLASNTASKGEFHDQKCYLL
jgi:hypothetical protein